eukprot:CAMPEP_0198199380 /NCGR_PEP_ID=MMETSP1445-20131203/2690_1 /TAXON_ID=36898 /ORGANISM="Pyramimonas sp., Strain CCMP2087" /LENGTH=135 /DNA_ID=CAMNT_0043869217 /DNA_START=407 /DNA_END=814 /DNA_ORIENTATION=-
MVPDLLQALEIVTELGVEGRRDDLGVATILNILLPVKEPVGNFVLAGVGDNHHESLKLSGGELASPLVHVNLSLLAGEDGETATHTPDGGNSEGNLLLAIHVSVDNTQNVLEIVIHHERHGDKFLKMSPPQKCVG